MKQMRCVQDSVLPLMGSPTPGLPLAGNNLWVLLSPFSGQCALLLSMYASVGRSLRGIKITYPDSVVEIGYSKLVGNSLGAGAEGLGNSSS